MSTNSVQSGVVQTLEPPHVEAAARGCGEDATAEARWYAVYTCANHEKRVAEQFSGRNMEHFLPEYETVRRWKDRKVRLQLPLFPGYLFVHMIGHQRLRVLQVPGVVQLVGFRGRPVALPDDNINRIREFLGQGWRAEPHPYLAAGRRARVVRGPLAGMEGIVVRRKNRSRLILSFDLIQRSMAIEMDVEDLATA